MKGKIILIGIFTFLIGIVILIILYFVNLKKIYFPIAYEGYLSNPMKGFAPRAENEELINSNISLVYVDLSWREWEPQKDQYAYEAFEEKNNLNRWKAEGKRVVFRFVCDYPGKDKHMDIPEWLYNETKGNGSWYDTSYGKGYSPNYNDPFFIERHKKALEALGKKYNKEDFFCFIELGSLGHWGEWHIKSDEGLIPIPKEEIRDEYVRHYLLAFPNTKLLMRRPFSIAANEKLGLFNDMFGNPDSTNEWLNWIEAGGDYSQAGEGKGALVPMGNAWQVAPIGGEFTSSFPMEKILGDNLEETFRELKKAHATFIGPKVPEKDKLDSNLSATIDGVHNNLGYKLRVEKVIIQSSIFNRRSMKLDISFLNEGIAPFYYNWDTYIYLINEEEIVVKKEKLELDLRKVITNYKLKCKIDTRDIMAGNYKIGIGIVDPLTGRPGIALAMEGGRSDKIYVIGEYLIK